MDHDKASFIRLFSLSSSFFLTLQVPSLGYAQEIVKSFHHDETWGERITVAFEQESYPVFLCNLPSGATAPELKAALNAARKKIPKKIKNKDQDVSRGHMQ